MFNARHILLLFIVINSCSRADQAIEDSLINTSHLDHLYQEIDVDSSVRLGTVWIYSNAPDYPLVNDEDEGFTCVDDVSRALVFYCREYKRNPVQENFERIESLTRFILYMKADNGYFNNFLFPDNGINTVHVNSKATANFWSWRAFWALTELNLLEAQPLNKLKAETIPFLEHLLDNIDGLFSEVTDTVDFEGIRMQSIVAEYGADQIAVIMIGLANYSQVNNSRIIEDLLLRLGQHLLSVQFGDENTSPYYAFLSWKNIWHAWGNMQAYALLYSGRIIQNEQFINAGLREVDHFYPYCIEQKFISDFRLVISNNSSKLHDLHSFPQIAYGIRPMIYASLEAYRITGEESYAIQAGKLAMWYFGNNPASQVMYDRLTGRGLDGINSASKINYNSGAESTIEALLSIQAMESDAVSKRILKENILNNGKGIKISSLIGRGI